jgi:hypothetical protein
MARKKAYTDPAVKEKLLAELRLGKTRKEAAGQSMTPLLTFEGWLRDDDELLREVDEAERVGLVARTENPTARDQKTGADRWRKLREDAAKLAPGMLGLVLAVDARTSALPNAHALSPWWRWVLTQWYESGKAVFLGRIGRGGGKSTTQTNVVLAESLFSPQVIPPGETWIWPFLSLDMDEANMKVGPFENAMAAIGIGTSDYTKHAIKGGRTTIEFGESLNRSVKVCVYPNTVSAMSGPTLAGATNDEEAKWKAGTDSSSGVKMNSAEEVLDAQGQCFRGDTTHKKHMRISSAWKTSGPHYEDIEAGDNELHFVARIGPFLQLARDGFELVATKLATMGKHDGAKMIREYSAKLTEQSPNVPSWVANPTHDVWGGFLRARMRVRKWLRENGSWSSDGVDEGDYFESEDIERGVLVTRVVTQSHDGRFAGMDTGTKKNPSAIAIVERVIHEVRLGTGTRERRYQFRPIKLEQWTPRNGRPLDLRNVVLPAMARMILDLGCVPCWWCDGYAGDQIELVGAAKGIVTKFVDTSRATQQVYEPIDTAFAAEPCPIVLSGCENIELAVAQLRQVCRSSDQKAIVQHVGTEHGEWGQVLARALAHAGVGTTPPDESASRFVGIPDRYSAFRGNRSRSYR